MNNMSDLSFTQTSRAMQSKHLSRASNECRPIWVIAATSNAKPKKVRLHKCKKPNVFTSL